MSDEASSTTTWETIVEQYRERAKRDDARIAELAQRANHWHDTAQMLKRQRDTAEEEREGCKIRAMKSEQQRQALRAECEALHTTNTNLRDQFILAEGQRDQAKADAEHWKGEWAVVMGQLGGARAEVEALRKYAAQWYEHITLKAAIDAALAVQPTTGDKHE